MPESPMQSLVERRQWPELERTWLAAVEQPDADPGELLPVIDAVVAAGQRDLADTMGWAWLSVMKETRPARDALRLGRGLLLRLPDGDQLRDEILTLYRQTHDDRPDLESWIDRSGLKAGKSVRRALRYLDTGLRIEPGRCLFHRTEDEAAEIMDVDPDGQEVRIRTQRRTRATTMDELVEDYEIAAEDDFRVLRQLRPERIAELLRDDPVRLVIGIVRSHGGRIDRDALKIMLVPQHLPAEKWPDVWTRVRNATKRSHHLRIEGRSPMMLLYDEVGQSLEEETGSAIEKAESPREWLEQLEGYLRETRSRKQPPDAAFIDRVQRHLLERIERFTRHHDEGGAFCTALVLERLALDGLPLSADAHGVALNMLKASDDPVAMAGSAPDLRLWPLAMRCVEQAFPDSWPAKFAELILWAPTSQCDAIAQPVEAAGHGELLPPIVERALADPGRFTDAAMWIWKGPDIRTPLPVPPPMEVFNLILALVGPARQSEGKVAGQSVVEMRAKVRAGLSHRDYARFRECLALVDDPSMGPALRRQVDRAEGLGATVQDAMMDIVRERFPLTDVKPKAALWEDDRVLYFTDAGLKTREQERDEIVNVKMRENARAIGEAASHGDLSENSEYKFALEERDLLRARLAQVNLELSMARVLEPLDVPEDHVSIGHRVTLRPTAGGGPVEITILGAGDGDLANRVYSYKTPIALRVLGKRPGDVVSMNLGEGEAEYSIERFENALARAHGN